MTVATGPRKFHTAPKNTEPGVLTRISARKIPNKRRNTANIKRAIVIIDKRALILKIPALTEAYRGPDELNFDMWVSKTLTNRKPENNTAIARLKQ